MFDITGCKFDYQRLNHNQSVVFITNPSGIKYSTAFNHPPNFSPNEQANQHIFNEFINNGKNFIIELQPNVDFWIEPEQNQESKEILNK